MSRRRSVAIALALGSITSGCGGKTSLGGESPSLSQVKKENGGAVVGEPLAGIPMPAEGGPKIAPTALVVPVVAAPERGAATIGFLRLGAKVARSPDAIGRKGCPEGWYAIRPAGFVCAGSDTTLKLDHPLVRALDVEPDRGKPMPYSYAFVRAIAPNYLRVPTKEGQPKYEARPG